MMKGQRWNVRASTWSTAIVSESAESPACEVSAHRQWIDATQYIQNTTHEHDTHKYRASVCAYVIGCVRGWVRRTEGVSLSAFCTGYGIWLEAPNGKRLSHQRHREIERETAHCARSAVGVLWVGRVAEFGSDPCAVLFGAAVSVVGILWFCDTAPKAMCQRLARWALRAGRDFHAQIERI